MLWIQGAAIASRLAVSEKDLPGSGGDIGCPFQSTVIRSFSH